MEPDSSLQCLQKPAKLEDLDNIRNETSFSSLVIGSPRPTPRFKGTISTTFQLCWQRIPWFSSALLVKYQNSTSK
jgi:hypothetical protein